MRAVVGDACDALRIVERHRVDVRHACVAAFAQEVHRLSVGREDGVAVLAGTVGQVGVPPCLGIIEPDVAAHRRDLVLAPLVFHSLLVLIEELAPVAAEADHLCRCGKHLCGASAADRHPIQLRQSCTGEGGTLGGVLYRCREQHILAVGRERPRRLGCRVSGEALGGASCRRHHEDVEVAVAVAGEGNLLAVGRPHRIALIGALRGELHGGATL